MNKSIVEPYFSEMTPIPTDLTVKGCLQNPISCLLCDIYGTLFISGSGDISVAQQQEVQYKKLKTLMIKYGLTFLPNELVQTLYASIRIEHQKSKSKGVKHPEIEIDKIWAEILPFGDPIRIRSFAVEFEMVMNPVWPMPGLKTLIRICRNHGIHLGIISNAQFFSPYLFQWYLGKDLHTLGFDPQLIFFSYEYGWAKPSGFLFALAVENLQKLGISVNQTAYIGNDIRNDMMPAQEVGFQTILFAGDARSLRMREDDPIYRDFQPDLRITHLNQLASYMIQD